MGAFKAEAFKAAAEKIPVHAGPCGSGSAPVGLDGSSP